MKKLFLSLSAILLVGTTTVLTSCSMKSTSIDVSVIDDQGHGIDQKKFAISGDGKTLIQGFAEEFLELFTYRDANYQGHEAEKNREEQREKLGQDAIKNYSFYNYLDNEIKHGKNIDGTDKDIFRDYFGPNNYLTKSMEIKNTNNNKKFGDSTPLFRTSVKDKKVSMESSWNSINDCNDVKDKGTFKNLNNDLYYLGKNPIQMPQPPKKWSFKKVDNKNKNRLKELSNVIYQKNDDAPDLRNNIFFSNVGEVKMSLKILDPKAKNSLKYNVDVKIPNVYAYLRLFSKKAESDKSKNLYWLEPFAYGFSKDTINNKINNVGQFANFKNLFEDCGNITYKTTTYE